MIKSKPSENFILLVYPFFSVFICLVVFAFIFDTFNLPLSAAFYNLLLLLPLLGLFLMLFRCFDIAVILASAVAFIVNYTDALLYNSRLTHIRFSDFMLISQATRVVNRYKLIWSSELTRRLVIVIGLCVLLVSIARYYKLSYRKRTVFFIGLGLFTVGALVIFADMLPHNPETFDFTSEAESNGLLYSWYCQYHESKLVEPEGYSKTKAEAILAAYEPTDGVSDVNIIVIMNESLADYELLGKPVFDDPLPNIHSYDKNFFYGKLSVSVFGGGTCNTEYEFLTGNSMAFLPEGITPYLQYVVDDENSIARDLGALGYSKTAIHPYYSEEWNRTQVYKFLGFDKFVSGADFGDTVATNGKSATVSPALNLISFGNGPLYVRGLISDQSSFEHVLAESDKQSFVFNVTMQNHGGYEYEGEDFVNREYVSEADKIQSSQVPSTRRNRMVGINSEDRQNEVYKVNQYLTCINLSDAAFKQLTDRLEKTDTRTIVLMFGDHQPALLIPEDFMEIPNPAEALYYDVPYMLWANYDIEFDAPEYTSPNYLSAILKKNAGLPLTAWDQFRLNTMKKYPVVAVDYILDDHYNTVDIESLNDYRIVQYMRMFD